jgi:uncharacterized membrane protein
MIRALVAFLGGILTATQALLIVVGREGICLNEGCGIVDSFPKLPPLYFNIAGCVFFFILSWCFLKGRKGSENWHQFAKVLLLAGLAGEGVLLFFQYSIVTAFCSYCLIIFSTILFLNILCGVRQLFTSVTIFIAVFAMLSTLELRGESSSNMSIDAGTYARIGEESDGSQMYLFFSETCEHCENIISILDGDNRCNIRFNPIDRIDHFSLPGSRRLSEYDPRVNTLFLKSLDIKEIPVLVAREQERTVVLGGEGGIKKYLTDECLSRGESTYIETSQTTGSSYASIIPGLNQQNEGCSLESDCEEVEADKSLQ